MAKVPTGQTLDTENLDVKNFDTKQPCPSRLTLPNSSSSPSASSA
jgi:hypothetical protein